jgi:hypothetical protein
MEAVMNIPNIESASKLYIVDTVHFHSISHFLNQQNAHFLLIIQHNFLL